MHLLGGYDPGDARGDAQRQSCQRGVVHGGRVGRLAPLHARVAAVRLGRAAQHLPGALVPVAGANHFTILPALREADGELTKQLTLLSL